jgi:hypothetical protein
MGQVTNLQSLPANLREDVASLRADFAGKTIYPAGLFVKQTTKLEDVAGMFGQRTGRWDEPTGLVNDTIGNLAEPASQREDPAGWSVQSASLRAAKAGLRLHRTDKRGCCLNPNRNLLCQKPIKITRTVPRCLRWN